MGRTHDEYQPSLARFGIGLISLERDLVLAVRDTSTDAALAANDAINDRAAAYKSAKLRPEARMDQLRVLAFPRAVITAGRAAGTYACPVASKVRVHLLES